MTDSARRPTIAFVGAGRAGSALAVALANAGFAVVAVCSRTAEHAATLAAVVGARVVDTPLEAVRRADITFLTVPDTALPSVAATVAASGAALRGHAVVHCSARLGDRVLRALHLGGADIGVMHPLQSMSGAASAPLLRGVYFRIEATGRLSNQLDEVISSLAGHRLTVDERELDLYHAAAVLAGNAPLALLAHAVELFAAAGVPKEDAHKALATLLQGAAANAREREPAGALTGPVVRGDSQAIAAHLAALRAHPEVRELYLRLVEDMQRLVANAADTGASPLHRVA